MTNDASVSRTTGALPFVTADRAHTLARTSAKAVSSEILVPSVISWKVRNTVEPEGTQPNRSSWEPQVLDVGTALAPTGQHERHLDEDLASVVQWEALTGPRDARRERIAETQTVGKGPKSVQADVGHDTGPAGFHLHASRAVSVRLGSALLVGILLASTPTVSPAGRAFPRTRDGQLTRRRERSGLTVVM